MFTFCMRVFNAKPEYDSETWLGTMIGYDLPDAIGKSFVSSVLLVQVVTSHLTSCLRFPHLAHLKHHTGWGKSEKQKMRPHNKIMETFSSCVHLSVGSARMPCIGIQATFPVPRNCFCVLRSVISRSSWSGCLLQQQQQRQQQRQ